MRRATLGSIVFFLVAPGTVAGLVPWLITRWRAQTGVSLVAQIGGTVLVAAWLVAFGAAVWSFVIWYEQPKLRQRYGASYLEYCAAVPGWWPRRTPYPRA